MPLTKDNKTNIIPDCLLYELLLECLGTCQDPQRSGGSHAYREKYVCTALPCCHCEADLNEKTGAEVDGPLIFQHNGQRP